MSGKIQYAPYKKIKLLGQGSFGKAYLAEDLSNNKMVVLKQIDLARMRESEKRDAYKEAEILKHLNHPNVVEVIDVFKTESGKLWIIMEYADGGDLEKKLKSRNGRHFSEGSILQWFTEVCLAVKHIHDRKIIHRDLKLQNIFLTRHGQVKLGDFGIARVLCHTREIARTVVGTPYYISPEIINNNPYSFETDIWSLGVILYELCCLSPPFQAKSLNFLALKIVKGQYKLPPSIYSKELHGLIASLLQVNPRNRPKINDLLDNKLLKPYIIKCLSKENLKDEFSHTVLHNQKINVNNNQLKRKFNDLKLIQNDKVAKPLNQPSSRRSSEREIAKDVFIIDKNQRDKERRSRELQKAIGNEKKACRPSEIVRKEKKASKQINQPNRPDYINKRNHEQKKRIEVERAQKRDKILKNQQENSKKIQKLKDEEQKRRENEIERELREERELINRFQENKLREVNMESVGVEKALIQNQLERQIGQKQNSDHSRSKNKDNTKFEIPTKSKIESLAERIDKLDKNNCMDRKSSRSELNKDDKTHIIHDTSKCNEIPSDTYIANLKKKVCDLKPPKIRNRVKNDKRIPPFSKYDEIQKDNSLLSKQIKIKTNKSSRSRKTNKAHNQKDPYKRKRLLERRKQSDRKDERLKTPEQCQPVLGKFESFSQEKIDGHVKPFKNKDVLPIKFDDNATEERGMSIISGLTPRGEIDDDGQIFDYSKTGNFKQTAYFNNADYENGDFESEIIQIHMASDAIDERFDVFFGKENLNDNIFQGIIISNEDREHSKLTDLTVKSNLDFITVELF